MHYKQTKIQKIIIIKERIENLKEEKWEFVGGQKSLVGRLLLEKIISGFLWEMRTIKH